MQKHDPDNFVSQGDDHILMFGTWFDTDTSGYGNERRIFRKKVVNLQEASNHKSWLIGDFELTHWQKIRQVRSSV